MKYNPSHSEILDGYKKIVEATASSKFDAFFDIFKKNSFTDHGRREFYKGNIIE